MRDPQRAMTGRGTTLTLDNTNTDPEKQHGIVGDLLATGLEYMAEDDVEEPGKDEPELEEDLSGLEPTPIELEEMSDMHEDLTLLQGSPELEAVSILTLPQMATEGVAPSRRATMRR